MKKLLFLLLLIPLLAALVGCGDGNRNSVSQTVAFMTEDVGTGNYQIKTMKFDGSAVTNVGTPDRHAMPFLSPDGKKVTFNDYSTGSDIGIMNIDGSGRTIFDLSGSNYEATVSRDGKKILFRSYPDEGGGADLILMNLDGSNLTNLTNQNGYCYHYPTLSRDGKTIATWVHGGEGEEGLAIINTDGTGMHIINTGNLQEPIFSADGKTLFVTNWDTENGDIYVVNIDGTNLKALTTGGYNWSPRLAGNKILFNSLRDSAAKNWEDTEIYSMDPDGNNITRLTNNTVYDGFGGGD